MMESLSPHRMRITTVVDSSLGAQLRELARLRGASVSGLVEEALRAYVPARLANPSLSLLGSIPRRNGRPSRLDQIAEEQRLRRLKKRTGRPLRLRADE